jgi:hypothetical protein
MTGWKIGICHFILMVIGTAFMPAPDCYGGYGILGSKYPILGIIMIWPIIFTLLIVSFCYFLINA